MVRHCICIDWLEIMVQGELVHFEQPLEQYEYGGGKYLLVKKGNGTLHFKHCYEVFQDGRKFATIFCAPRSPEIIKPDFIQVKIENTILYERFAINETEQFLQAMNWKIRNVTRLDIALDGADVLQLVDGWNQKIFGKKGRASVTCYYTGNRELQGFDIGKRSSDKWMTGYNKSAELEVSNKQYIRKFWELCGLQTFETVNGVTALKKIERLELKLRNEEIKKIAGFDWLKLADFSYLASILRMHCKNYFEFYDAKYETEKNRSRIPCIDTWCDWDAILAYHLDKLTAVETSEIYRMKMTAKTLYWTYLQTGAQYYADIAQEMAININCIEWYIRKLDSWRKKYEYMSGMNPDGEIKLRYLSRYKQYGENEQLRLFAFEPAQA